MANAVVLLLIHQQTVALSRRVGMASKELILELGEANLSFAEHFLEVWCHLCSTLCPLPVDIVSALHRVRRFMVSQVQEHV